MKPTAAELEILSVLWEQGPITVKDVHEVINRQKPTLYTTVLKHLQIMQEKGLVARDEHSKAHIYRAVAAKKETQKNLVSDMLERVFRGSAAQLVQHVLESKAASPEELKEIRKMIRQAEKDAEKDRSAEEK
ncbi:MAG TPA: BlaI/MecI/CopY family transcriptional regulator [Pyrinomonadaceae bacterium]|jgi:predicted transcriptional regulator|nr:BlaI/MecI/CopY family transcriptional regulator [Pyrinomonadaceae bacterium]